MTQTGCTCPDPDGNLFWCDRHQCQKTAHWWELCRTQPAYFQVWEEGKGPGQGHLQERLQEQPVVEQRSVAPSRTMMIGPGTELRRLLHSLGIHEKTGCQCNKRAKMMDENGPQWCRENMETILDWLRQEARKRNIPWVLGMDRLAKYAVMKAIHNAERKMKETR